MKSKMKGCTAVPQEKQPADGLAVCMRRYCYSRRQEGSSRFACLALVHRCGESGGNQHSRSQASIVDGSEKARLAFFSLVGVSNVRAPRVLRLPTIVFLCVLMPTSTCFGDLEPHLADSDAS